MTLQPVWPLWALAVALVPLLGLAIWRVVVSSGERRVDWLRRLAMLVCVLGIGLVPSVPRTAADSLTSNAELYFVVDRTGSMAAEDYDGDQARLVGVQSDMVDLARSLPGSRYAIIGFDSQATRQLPLTTDARAVRTWADTVAQEVTAYSAGSSVDRPLAALEQMLIAAQERNPANIRLVFFLSDGENTDGSGSDGEDMASFEALAPLIDGGAVLGYGTTEGGPMRSYDGTDRTGFGTDAPYITDTDGSDAISRIDETTLRTIADQMGVPYTHRIAPGGVEALVEDVDLQEIASDGRRDLTTYTGVYWPVAAVLTLLLGWEAWHLVREIPRRRADGAVQARDRRRAAGDPLAGGRGA